MLRSVLAIVGGFIVITGLSLAADALLMSIAPAWFTGNGGTKHLLPLVSALIYGGYFTAWVARRAEYSHAFILAAILLMMSILATVQMYETAPLWWHLLMLIQIIPAVMIGADLRSTRKRTFYPLKACSFGSFLLSGHYSDLLIQNPLFVKSISNGNSQRNYEQTKHDSFSGDPLGCQPI